MSFEAPCRSPQMPPKIAAMPPPAAAWPAAGCAEPAAATLRVLLPPDVLRAWPAERRASLLLLLLQHIGPARRRVAAAFAAAANVDVDDGAVLSSSWAGAWHDSSASLPLSERRRATAGSDAGAIDAAPLAPCAPRVGKLLTSRGCTTKVDVRM